MESNVYINMLHTYALINQQMALSFFIGTLVLFRLLACKLQFIFSVLGMQNEKKLRILSIHTTLKFRNLYMYGCMDDMQLIMNGKKP